MKPLRLRLVLLLASAIAPMIGQVCCSAPRRPVSGIELARGATFDLQAPSELGRSVSLEQIIEAKYGEREFSFHCLLEVDPEQLVLVGMTPFHTRAFTLILQNGELSVDMAPGAQLPAPPERILADLQLALWPDPRVRGLELTGAYGIGTEGRVVPPSDRCFRRNGAIVIYISYASHLPQLSNSEGAPWTWPIHFQHNEQGYEFAVRTLRAESLLP